MDHSSIPVNRSRRSNSRTGAISFTIYRRDSNMSTSSFIDDVEMAHDEVRTSIMNPIFSDKHDRFFQVQCRKGESRRVFRIDLAVSDLQ